jgi:hypothetical protein
MWTQVQKILQQNGQNGSGDGTPPVIPLRKPSLDFAGLGVGKSIVFSAQCPLPPLSGTSAAVVAVRLYRFGEDSILSYQLRVQGNIHYSLTIAEDEQGKYLGVTRALTEAEQDSWFGRDALGFFTEASSAKSIRCKADLMVEGEWAGARYSKTVDWIEGTLAPAESPRLARSFHYNLLVNEPGDKALEIEHDDVSGENRILVTVYRPIEDISRIEDTPVAAPAASNSAAKAPPVYINDNSPAQKQAEPPLFREPVFVSPAQPKQRQDFRRLEEVAMPEIHIERTPTALTKAVEPSLDFPAFLLARHEEYLSLDEVIPPENERVRVAAPAAHALLGYALHKQVRVRDVLREMLGLQSALSEEVIFEMPLSDEDYCTLAMRYKLRPDHRIEIRARLEEELRHKLSLIAKA